MRRLGLGSHLTEEAAAAFLAQQNKRSGLTGTMADSGQPAAPPQSLLGPQGGAAYLLGQGMRAGGLGRPSTNFKRYAVNRGGRILEAHDYGDGDIRYFARKNPAILQAAVQQSLGNRATPQMSPQDEELLKLLLGNPTLR